MTSNGVHIGSQLTILEFFNGFNDRTSIDNVGGGWAEQIM
jgi:hypothetical protein